MTGCATFVYDQEHDSNKTTQFGGASADGTVHVGMSVNDGLYYSLTNYTPITMIHDPTANAGWEVPVVDSSDKVWWTETPDFSNYNLMRSELDGSSVTTVATITGLPPTAFTIPAIRYDPVGDRLWFTLDSPSTERGIWSLTKAGVATKRYAISTAEHPGWGPVIADDGGVWMHYGNTGTGDETVVRVDGSTFAATTIAATFLSSRFQVAFAAGNGGGVIARDNATTRLYLPGITNAVADCDLGEVGQPATYSPFGKSYSTPDFTHNYYAVGNGCPFWSLIWDREAAQATGIPPLRVYMRDDRLDVSGARADGMGATSWQQSIRVRQGASYL